MTSVDAFATVAIQYCDWAEAESQSPVADILFSLQALPQLIHLATQLPDVFDPLEAANIPDETYRSVYKRFQVLPVQHYSQCFDPLQTPPEPPVTADIADDLSDVWRDLKRGIILYKAGHVDAAVWEWRFHFIMHWGHHATGALYALHAWASQNNDKVQDA